MKTVCASEMVASLGNNKKIDFAQKYPELSLWGTSQIQNYIQNLIYKKKSIYKWRYYEKCEILFLRWPSCFLIEEIHTVIDTTVLILMS